MKTFSITDTGVTREMNQDYYFATDTNLGNLPNLFIVADEWVVTRQEITPQDTQ